MTAGVPALESTGFGSGRIVVKYNPEYPEKKVYDRQYFITDHLGSVRVVFDQSGEVIARNDYYPFGKQHDNPALIVPTAPEDNRFLFNGKEKQLTGGLNLLDYGWRMYDPEVGRWFGVDKLAENYYSVSPYVFTMNNPVFFVDPNGLLIWIHFMNADGTEGKILYEVGMEADHEDDYVNAVINTLNNIYLNGGDKLIEMLGGGTENNFDIKNEAPLKGGDGGFSGNNGYQSPGGTIRVQYSTIKSMSFTGIEIMAHELFHALQYELGEGKSSVFKEVEAYVFGYGTTVSWAISTGSDMFSKTPMGQENEFGKAYESAFWDLVLDGYSQDAMHNTIQNFLQGASVNDRGTYNNRPLYSKPDANSILDSYYTGLNKRKK